MSGFDRYSFMQKKEAFGRFLGGMGILLGGIYEYCNSSTRRRIVSGICLALVLFGMVKLFSSGSSSGGPGGSIEALSARDRSGNRWVLEPIKGQPMSKFADIGGRPGEPLTVKADVQSEGRDVSIGLVVMGWAGEKYVGGARKNGKWQNPPVVNIYDAKGKLIHNSKFEYG